MKKFFLFIVAADSLKAAADEIMANRRILWNAMLKHGFTMLDSEWWHFTLANEPYPDTYFNFPVRP